MFSHIIVGANDADCVKSFYDAQLGVRPSDPDGNKLCARHVMV
jgi:hypothetical protein